MDAISGAVAAAGTGYGARPVSVDLTRNQRLTKVAECVDAGSVARRLGLPTRPSHVAEQLALGHWPADQHICVCSVAGGTGRTTLAGLIALTLAGLPYAHLHRPVALAEIDPSPLSRSRHRWGAAADADHVGVTLAGGRVQVLNDFQDPGDGRPVVVVDTPAGIVTTARLATADPTNSIVLLTRPDWASLAETADALVWLQDSRGIARDRVAVVINDGVGRADPGSRPAATTLRIRCRTVHRLPAHVSLSPGTVLPCGQRVPRSIRTPLTQLCADVHRSIRPAMDANPPSKEESDAEPDA